MTNFSSWSDSDFEDEILRVRRYIETWARTKDLWFDCAFASYLEHVGGEPSSPPVVILLCCEGGLNDVLFGEDSGGLESEFSDMLGELGYWYENLDGVKAAIYPDNEELSNKFEEYFHWKWVCELLKEDTADVYEELYSHFVNRPDDLHRLHWRDFEVLLFRIFQNHGFKAVLGPGRGDEGVDLRLWHEDPLGDVLTLVQAKKFAPHRSIDQTQVAALFGVSVVEEADKALFVTTSNYAPVAKRFASRTSGVVELAEKRDIVSWCKRATGGVIKDKTSLLSIHNVSKIISEVSKKCDSRIVHTSFGYNMSNNRFALVVKESRHSALLLGLTNQTISDDGYGQRGYQVPKLEVQSVPFLLSMENVWRAKRKVENGNVTYWDGMYLFSQWNGQPTHFNYMD